MRCCGPLQRAAPRWGRVQREAQAVVTGEHEGRATGEGRENAVYSTYPLRCCGSAWAPSISPTPPQDLRLHASLNRSLLRVVWFPRVGRIPGGRACKGLEGTVQNEAGHGALLPRTDGYIECEV